MNSGHWANLIGLAVPAVHVIARSDAGIGACGHRKHPQNADNSYNQHDIKNGRVPRFVVHC